MMVESENQLTKINQFLLTIIGVGVLLYFGRVLFLPLSFAVLISFILYPFCRWIENKKIPRSIAIGIGLGLITTLIALVIYLLGTQFVQFEASWPSISEKVGQSLEAISQKITEILSISRSGQNEWVKNSITRLISTLGSALLNSGGSLAVVVIVPVYSALILYNREGLVNILLGFFHPSKKDTILRVLHKTIKTYYDFIKGMLTVYLIVGLLNSLGLLIIGIPQAFLFGFVASILTFIPYIGIMIASLLPITVAWITKDSAWYAAGVVIVFAIVQYLEANIIFPMAVSSRLKINTLATLSVMFIGGILWGAAGMILFIPFAAITKLIADEVDPEGTVARLLGNGK